MTVLEPLRFDAQAEKDLYQLVERAGSINTEAARETSGLDQDAFRDHVERLEQKGYIEEADDELSLVLDIGTEESHHTADFDYEVRPAREEDFESLVETIREIAAKETYAIAEHLAEELYYDDTVVRHNSAWSRVFFVALVDGHVAGWSHLDLPQIAKLRRTAELTVGVREEYRGYGIGETLLEKALDWADANDYVKVYNSVARTNGNAITFLTAHGWDREAVRPNHFTIGGKQVDEVLLAYTFPERLQDDA